MSCWFIRKSSVDINKMAAVLNISVPTACVIANRGIRTKSAAVNFLYPNIQNMIDFRLIKDADKAIDIIKNALAKNDKIMVFGDYDVDGVMSTVILYKTLKKMGADVSYYVPHRQQEGYGLNCDAVKRIKQEGYNVILTCDNGIAAIDEIYLAKKLGMTVIVLDHHEQAKCLPEADAIINPKQNDCHYPFKMLCAAGIAYKFSELLHNSLNINFEDADEFLVLAAMATICDIVDLLDENRIIAKIGLKKAPLVENIGLKALYNITNLSDKEITTYHVGFILGPCINAAGRLESAEIAIRLLTTESEAETNKLANKLASLNISRKEATQEAVIKLINQLEKNNEQDKILVIYDTEIHESIAGIIAGRLKEHFYKPAIVITNSLDLAKGSGRSIEGYNMFQELQNCSELFERFGGHPMAAGISLKIENIPKLREALNKNCTLTEDKLIPQIKIDMHMPLHKINMKLAEELLKIAPYGKANPQPLFAEKGIHITKIDYIGNKKDILRFNFKVNDSYITAISFDGYNKFKNIIESNFTMDEARKILQGGHICLKMDFVFSININEYNNFRNVQLNIKDFRLSKER